MLREAKSVAQRAKRIRDTITLRSEPFSTVLTAPASRPGSLAWGGGF